MAAKAGKIRNNKIYVYIIMYSDVKKEFLFSFSQLLGSSYEHFLKGYKII